MTKKDVKNRSREKRKGYTTHTGKGKPTLVFPRPQAEALPLPYRVRQWVKRWLQSCRGCLCQISVLEYRLAKHVRKYVKGLIVNALTLGIFTLVGLNSSAVSSPLITFASQHWILSGLIGVMLALYIFRVFRVGSKPELEGSNKYFNQNRNQHLRSFSLVNSLSYLGSTCFLLILVLVLLQPAGCPTILCPSPQLIRVQSLHPRDIHDSNLEVYFIQLESASYMIPGDPAQYTADNEPKSTGVLQADGQNSTGRYHLILGLQSLLHGSYGISIQKVELVVKNVSQIPSPLNIWHNYGTISYEKEIQGRAVYFGQESGAFMPVVLASPQGDYSGLQTRFVHLESAGTDQVGETDQIDVHIISWVKADIQFVVQVTYRIDNESFSHTLKLPSLFEIVFADPSDWHLYQFLNGHFVAES